ncbi:BA75_03174T0 [Komagataella pastoris]|uniref:BA75_03174T0 n=1 Tax=Komagataella pastoris TaxID=4922 RepID=A0A1B2JCA7_PICPA|nr:BA75_03174T0 [Komagataella pastoris]
MESSSDNSPLFLEDSAHGYLLNSISPLSPLLNKFSLDKHSSPSSIQKTPEVWKYPVPLDPHLVKRLNCVEELILTETAYVVYLKLFFEYFSTPILTKIPDSPPFFNLNRLLNLIINQHSVCLDSLKVIYPISFYEESELFGFPQRYSSGPYVNEELITDALSITNVFKLFQVILSQAICKPLYHDFFTLFPMVSSLLNQFDLSAFESSLQNDISNLLTIPDNKLLCSDLSPNSLLHKPVARLGKYRLLLENILLTFPKDTSDLDELNVIFTKIKEALNDLNNGFILENDMDLTSSLTQVLNRTRGNSEKMNIPLKYDTMGNIMKVFGRLIMCGGLYCIYNTKLGLKTGYLGCVLFKSHLILIKPEKNISFKIIFIIPLSVCRMLNPKTNSVQEGLSTDYPFYFKLIVEHDFSLYEVLFVCMNQDEYNSWLEQLELLIFHVNGPYPFDYRVSHMARNDSVSLMSYYPSLIIPYDLDLDNSTEEQRTECYFKSVIYFSVAHFKDTNDLNSDYTTRDLSFFPSNNCQTIQIRRSQRVYFETQLGLFWSPNLPLTKKDTMSEFRNNIRSTMNLKSVRFSNRPDISDLSRPNSTPNFKSKEFLTTERQPGSKKPVTASVPNSILTKRYTVCSYDGESNFSLRRKTSSVFSSFFKKMNKY